jgi:hypothetical protein
MEDITLSSMLFSRSLALIPYGQSVDVSTACFTKLKLCATPAHCNACFYDWQNKQELLSGTELTTSSLQQKCSKNYDMENISLNFVIVKISLGLVVAFTFF